MTRTVHFLQTRKKDHNEAALFEAAQRSSFPVTFQPLKTFDKRNSNIDKENINQALPPQEKYCQ